MKAAPIYLDWNATTPPHPSVLAVMAAAAADAWANPASVHSAGRRALSLVDGVREKLAAICRVHSRDVIFTSGGTEANNLALSAAPGLIASHIEHPSVTRVVERLARLGKPVAWVPVPSSGRLEPAAFEDALGRMPRGAVVALMAANHETGALQPLEQVAEIVHAHGATLHVDAVQALGKVPAEMLRVADSLTLAAHKIRGPKGVGALAFRGRAPHPVLVGGSQQRGLRPGTVDAVAIAGFGAALDWACDSVPRYAALAALRNEFERRLASVANATSRDVLRLPHVSSLVFEGRSGDELVAALDLLGVCVSSGSACSAGTTEPSPSVAAMLGVDAARASVRVSLGEDTTAEELDRAVEAIFAVLRRSRTSAQVKGDSPSQPLARQLDDGHPSG
ncbi:MAG TPA: cysteine desulfurase family protein [Polyangiaceae bacterium]